MITTLDAQPQEWMEGDEGIFHTVAACHFKNLEHIEYWIHKTAQVERHFGVSANRPTLIAELDLASGDHVFHIARVPSVVELQESLAVTVGDAVHNLRSALDHLIFQLACLNTNGSPKDERNIQFPIADSPDVYAGQAKRHLQEVDKARQATIERYQPYHGAAG